MKRLAVFLLGCGGMERIVSPKEGEDTGQGPTLLGELELSSTALEFGQVEVGSSASLDLTLTNVGQEPATLLSALIDDPTGAFDLLQMSGIPTELAANGQVVMTVGFTPVDEQVYDATLALETDFTGAEQVAIALSGEGWQEEVTGPHGSISVSPAALDMGQVDLDGEGTASFTISNAGDDDLLVDDIVMGDSALDYDIDGYLPILLYPSESEQVDIILDPTSEGLFSSWVRVDSDDPEEHQTQVAVEAEVVDLCDICAPVISVDTGGADDYSMSFYILLIFASSDTQAVSVRNIGDQALQITDVYINNDWFSTTGTFTTNWGGNETVLPGESTRFNVTFAASSLTGEMAWPDVDWNILHIKSNDPAQPDYQVELSASAF